MKNKIAISFSNLFFIITLLSCSYIALEPVSDNDTWWHIKTGEYIVKNYTVPTTDVFSFYGKENQLSWTAHEWLTDVILYFIYKIGGFPLLTLFPILLLGLTLFILYQIMKPIYHQNFLIGTVWLFVAGFTLALFSSTRPHMFSYVLFSLTVMILYSFILTKSLKIWLLPFLSVLWVNLHGGSSALLFVMILMVLFSSYFPLQFGRLKPFLLSKNQKKTLVIVFLLSIFSACLNPYGWKMLFYPIINMLDKTMLDFIIEWKSPDLHKPEGIVIFIIVFITITILLLSKRSISLLEFLVLSAFTYLTFKSIRQVVYFVIALTPIMSIHLPLLKRQNIKNITNTIIAVLFSIIFVVQVTHNFLQSLNIEEYPSKKALMAVEQLQPKRLFNDYNWGGYIIFHLHDKGIEPFIDGRADIFSKYTLKDYDTIYRLQPNWKNTFDKYYFDAVLFPTNSSLISELIETKEWEVYYKDNISTLLVKKQDSKN